MSEITATAHEAGAYAGFDLAHALRVIFNLICMIGTWISLPGVRINTSTAVRYSRWCIYTWTSCEKSTPASFCRLVGQWSKFALPCHIALFRCLRRTAGSSATPRYWKWQRHCVLRWNCLMKQNGASHRKEPWTDLLPAGMWWDVLKRTGKESMLRSYYALWSAEPGCQLSLRSLPGTEKSLYPYRSRCYRRLAWTGSGGEGWRRDSRSSGTVIQFFGDVYRFGRSSRCPSIMDRRQFPVIPRWLNLCLEEASSLIYPSVHLCPSMKSCVRRP